MARYRPQERHSLQLPVVLSEQLIPGSFAFALDYLVDHEFDLSASLAEAKAKAEALSLRLDTLQETTTRDRAEAAATAAGNCWQRGACCRRIDPHPLSEARHFPTRHTVRLPSTSAGVARRRRDTDL